LELITRACEPSQSHPLEVMMNLEVRKPHLDLLALIRDVIISAAIITSPSFLALFIIGHRSGAIRRCRSSSSTSTPEAGRLGQIG
jgi:hypothetical protein